MLLTWHDADFGFEDSHIKPKQDIAYDSLLKGLVVSNATTCNQSMTSLTFHSLGGHLKIFCSRASWHCEVQRGGMKRAK